MAKSKKIVDRLTPGDTYDVPHSGKVVKMTGKGMRNTQGHLSKHKAGVAC